MKDKILNLIEWVLSSFDNVSKGASGKKLTAFAITLTYCYSHRYVDAEHLQGVLLVDGSLIAGLFGINVVEKIKVKDDK